MFCVGGYGDCGCAGRCDVCGVIDAACCGCVCRCGVIAAVVVDGMNGCVVINIYGIAVGYGWVGFA